MTTTLESLIAQQQSNGATGVIDGHEAVTLRPAEGGLIEAYYDGAIQLLQPEAAVIAVDEPERQVSLLRGALLVVHERGRATQHEFQEVMERIRGYAIDKYREGQFCREGLNEFLRTFGLAEYHED